MGAADDTGALQLYRNQVKKLTFVDNTILGSANRWADLSSTEKRGVVVTEMASIHRQRKQAAEAKKQAWTHKGGGLLKSTRKAGTDADDDYVQQASEAADMHERAFEDSREMRKLFKDLDNLAKAKQVPKPPSSTPVNTGHASFRHSTFCQIY